MKPIDTKQGLTAKRVRELFSYDPETGNLHWRERPSMKVMAGDAAGNRLGEYLQITIDTRRYMAHRLVWLHVTGRWPKEQIDHINGKKSDNRFENLREATAAENTRNRKPHKGKRFGLKGISQHGENSFRAMIWVNGKNRHLGSFPTKEEAAEAYRRAARKHFGGFAHGSSK